MDNDPFIIREFVPSDLPFIMSTWLRELHATYGGPLPDKMWYDVHRQLIEKMFASRLVDIKILAARDNEQEIIAYIVVATNEALLWIHVRPKFRNHQLALHLLTLVKALEIPLAFQTPLSRLKLRNPVRARNLRPLMERL